MNRRIMIGIIIAVVGIGLIGVGILVIGRIVQQSLAPLPQPTPVSVITQPVVVLTHDLALGTLIRTEDVALKEMPVEFITSSAITDISMAIGRFARVPLVSGEILLNHHLADPTNVNHDIPLIIGEDKVIMAFPINDLMSSLNIIQRGDTVDILASIDVTVPATPTSGEAGGEENATISKMFTFDAMPKIEISAVVADVVYDKKAQSGPTVPGQPTPTPVPSQVTPKAYLLVVAPQDALVLKHLIDSSAIFDIVLRSPASTQIFEVNPVMPEYIVQRYKLVISR